MYIKDLKFTVEFSIYSEKHFCKDFFKKYKPKMWLNTKQSINDILERSYGFLQTDLIDLIKYSNNEDIGIFKLDFKVAGTNQSPKSSGNRAVFALNNQTATIKVLLVYSKDHCKKGQSETQWIHEHIKLNFPEYKNLCK
jgi:hypothetical protein